MSKKRTREQRKADNIAAETQRRIDAGDTSNYVQKQIANNPGKFENTERVAQKVAQKENKIQKSSDVKVSKEKKTKQNILSKIGHGDIEEDYIGDDEFLATVPAGQHKLRTQFDRLVAKYGPDFATTSQGQQLLGYLSGVSVNKGGGMGAPDPTFGTGVTIQDTAAQQARLDAINQMKGIGSLEAAQSPGTSQIIQGLDTDLLREGLTPAQYFNFNQQLMQANVPAYEKARPWSSGAAIPAIGGALISPIKTVGTGIYNALTGKKNEPKLDPIFTGEPLDPKLFYDLDEIEQSGLMGTEVAKNRIDSNDPDDPDEDPPPGYDSWGEFYAATGISEGEGKWVDGQYYFNYADGGIASLDNGQFDTAEADSLMFRDPVENDEWEYNV